MRSKTITGCGIVTLVGILSLHANYADEMQSLPPAPSTSATAVTPSAPTASSTIEKIITDVPPYTDKAVAMAPMRPLCAFLGAHVEYSDGIITLTKNFGQTPPGTRIITIRTGGGVAQVQDATGRHTMRLALPAEERLNVVFVPLRFIVQILGGSVERIPEGEVTVIRVEDRAGVLTPVAQEGYRGADAARLTIMNQVGRALSLRLVGPQHLSVELGRNSTITRSVRPGVYAYRAASTGMKPMSGVRRLLAGRKAIWAWGHR